MAAEIALIKLFRDNKDLKIKQDGVIMEKIDELPNAENLTKTHDLMTLKTESLFNEDVKKPHSNSLKSAIDSDIQATHFSASSEIEFQEELQRLDMSPSKSKNQLLGTAMVK